MCLADQSSNESSTLFLLIAFDIITSHQWPVFFMSWCINNLRRWLHSMIFLSLFLSSPNSISQFLPYLPPRRDKYILGPSLICSLKQLDFSRIPALGGELWIQFGMDNQIAAGFSYLNINCLSSCLHSSHYHGYFFLASWEAVAGHLPWVKKPRLRMKIRIRMDLHSLEPPVPRYSNWLSA